MYLFVPRPGKPQDTSAWQGEESFDIEKISVLEKQEGKAFKILQLTDTQLDVPRSTEYLKSSIDTLVEQAKPDLIVLTGDMTAGVFTHFHVNTLIDILDSYKIPWAPVFGNHDRELNANLYYQSKQFSKSEYCLFKEGPANVQGVGNYVINVKEGEKYVYSLFMIDSNANRKYIVDGEEVDGYDYIYPSQIEWYADNVNKISQEAGKIVPSIAFFHIPLPEFATAFDMATEGNKDAELLYGVKKEGVCCPLENTHLFDKMVELKSTTNICVGHDHVNDYVVKYKGITMSYGLKTGDFSYYDEERNGGTVISIDDDGVTLENINVAE